MIQKHHSGTPEKKPSDVDISGKKHMLMKFGPPKHTSLTPHGEVLKKARHGEMEWDAAKHETARATKPVILSYENVPRTDPDALLNDVFERHGISVEKRHDLASLEKANGALEHDLEGQRAVLRELQSADVAREERMKLVGRIVSIQNALDITRRRIAEHKGRHI